MDNVLKKKPVNMEDMHAYNRILSNLGIVNEAICSTAAATAAKTITLGATFKLENKATVLVTFTNGISVANATLAITHTTIAGVETTEIAKPIYLNGAALGADIIPAGATVILRYNGTLFEIIGGAGGKNYTAGDGIDITSDEISVDDSVVRKDSSSDPVVLPDFSVGTYLGTCSTAAATAAKEATITGYELQNKSVIVLTFTNGNTAANPTLNVNSKGAKAIYFKGAALGTDVVKANDIITLVYNGTQFEVVSILSSGYPNDKQDTITDMKQLGFGLATCATAGNVQAKEASITNFVLKENAFVSILFTNGFTVSEPTLNINSTGAKEIKYLGEPLNADKVRNNTILTMVYNGTDFNVIAVEQYGDHPVDGAVDLGLPSGTLWATKNIGAASPDDPGFYFSWGNIESHQPWYDFGSSNSGVYASTLGASLTDDIAQGGSYDAARAILGSPWRIPSVDDFQELYDNTVKEWIQFGVRKGVRFTSIINGNSIFLCAAGVCSTERRHLDIIGHYWNSKLRSGSAAGCLLFDESTTSPVEARDRYYGMTIRPIC